MKGPTSARSTPFAPSTADLQPPHYHSAKTWLITGARGAGKTTVLRTLVERLGPGITGVLSLPVYAGDAIRTGIDALLLPDRAILPLARVREQRDLPGAYRLAIPSADPSLDEAPLPPGDTLHLGPYCFFLSTVERVNTYLQGMLQSDPPGALVIDEVGPLELKMGGGFLPALNCVLPMAVPLFLTVRPDLVEVLRSRVIAAGRSPEEIMVVEIEEVH